MGNMEEAVPYLWDYAAKAKDPAPSAYYILGIDEWNRGDYDAAGKLFQQAVNDDNAMGQSAYLYLGQTYLKQGNTNSALMAFQKAYGMTYDPATRETAFYNYAVAKSNGGKAPFENSAAIFEDFIASYPDSRYAPAVQRHIVSGYLANGNYDKAVEVADRFKNPTSEVHAAKQRALSASPSTKSMTATPRRLSPTCRRSRVSTAAATLSATKHAYGRANVTPSCRSRPKRRQPTAPTSPGRRRTTPTVDSRYTTSDMRATSSRTTPLHSPTSPRLSTPVCSTAD